MHVSNDLIVECHGGLGDQLCAEPVLRFMEKKWPHYSLHIVTNYPELFSHLRAKAYDHGISIPHARVACTHPKNGNPQDDLIDFQQIHTVDYISLRFLKITLPNEDRQPRIDVFAPHLETVMDLTGPMYRSVLIHAGKSWDSKTFPQEYWQSVVDSIVQAGYRPILIGHNYWANNKEHRGVVPIDYEKHGKNCLSLIDKLSLKELCAAISLCPILISNDSGPIHLAGAFNNHVGVISTVRRPETLFHWRNGIQGYRYTALENKRIYDSFIPDAINGEMTYNLHSMSQEKMLEALPSAEKIVQYIERCFDESRPCT